MYDDYKFVTRDELVSLGLESLIGTGMLKPYMHGFFIDAKLHARSKSVLEPFAYDDYRKQKIKWAPPHILFFTRVPRVMRGFLFPKSHLNRLAGNDV